MSAAPARRPLSPRAAPCSSERTVISRMAVREASVRMASTHRGCSGCRGARRACTGHRGCRRPARRTGPRPGCSGARASASSSKRRSTSPRRLGDQGEASSRHPLPAGIPELAGPGERLLEELAGARRRVPRELDLAQQRLRPRQEGQPRSRSPTSIDASRSVAARVESPRSRWMRPSIDRTYASLASDVTRAREQAAARRGARARAGSRPGRSRRCRGT